MLNKAWYKQYDISNTTQLKAYETMLLNVLQYNPASGTLKNKIQQQAKCIWDVLYEKE